MLLWLAAVAGLCACGLVVRAFLIARDKGHTWQPEERSYVDPADGAARPFPSVYDAPSLYISLVVPAYKEQDRLPVMMDETLQYLKQRAADDPSFTWEIIVVDDGSPDATFSVAQSYAQREGCQHVRVLRLLQNRGKGGAVRRGMMQTRGQLLLMVDADGATKISDLLVVERHLKRCTQGPFGVAVGSRAHIQDAEAATATRKLHRRILQWGFHTLVSVLGVRGIRDTQCGFKLFTRAAAASLFPYMHIERWAFDVELLVMAYAHGFPITEVPVNWHEVDGSKLDPLTSTVQMARDLFRIRLMYLLGFWSIRRPPRGVLPS